MDKKEAQIMSWLEEISDFENGSIQIVDENVSDSDGSSHHSEHNTETEQSVDSDVSNKKEPFPIVVLSEILPFQRQRTSTSDVSSRSSATLVCHHPRSRRRKRIIKPQASTSAQTQVVLPVAPASQPRRIRVPMYQGKDGTKWLIHSPLRPNIRTRQENIVINRPGVKGEEALKCKIPVECFHLFITDSMIDGIVLFTNTYIRAHKENFSRERDAKETNVIEVKGLIGLLLMAGLKKMNHANIQEMWGNDGTAPDVFRATMSIKRFYFLLRHLRFDDMNTRTERTTYDNMAAMRDIFQTFVMNCQKHYQIGEYCTIDEMLESFRGRCKFRVYMANKPAKYGIKIYALVDAKSFYTSNLEVYAGKQPPGQFNVDNSANALVKRLSQNILNTGRNITMDNFFTSIPLADQLLNNHRTTIVGTLRKNKKEIPPNFLNTKDRAKPSSMFGFGEKKVLLSYVPNKKQKKIVLLLSTLHDDDKIDESTGPAAKPELITFYNRTKGGVDVVDQMKEEYSVGRMTRRWPMRLFFSMMNIAGINSQIIYKANTEHLMLRREYLKEIAMVLVKQYMTTRSSVDTLSIPLRNQIARFVPTEQASSSKKEGKCSICPSKKNRRTKKGCSRCPKLLCNEHCTYLCEDCFDKAYPVDLENV
ncbi:hypothetical protein FQR65_LT10347 [Abscondita terminalis]|nr:hypothetical protein FQR65_LT10347 [Abscondita terminalis]